FPGSYALPIERSEVRSELAPIPTIGRNVAILVVAAAVIGIDRIEEDDVHIGLEDPARSAVPRKSQRLTGHDGVVLVRPHIEFLDLVPELGLVHRVTKYPKPRRRDPRVF